MAVSRKVASLAGAAGFALLSVTGSALAEDKFTWGVSATGTSDYVFRGISQTDNDPAIQGAIDVGYGMFYAGVWGSGLDFGVDDPDAQIELDYYAGITPTWGPVTFDFGLIYYNYPGAAPDSDILELKAGASGNLTDKLSVGVTAYLSPDIYNDYDYGVYEGTASYTLPNINVFAPSVSGVVGYVDSYSGGGDYTYWNAGLGLAVENISFDFRYWDNDIDTGDCAFTVASTCDERFVFSVGVSVP